MDLIEPKWMDRMRSWARILFRQYSLPRWLVFLFDGSAVILSFHFAYILRFNFEWEAIDLGLTMSQSLIVLGAYWFFEVIFRSFAGLIRHTTIRDIFNVFVATTSSLLFLVLLIITARNYGWDESLNIPLSILLIHFITLNACLFFVRILIKMIYEIVSVKPASRKNVVIFGAGTMGVIVKRVINGDTANRYNIVAFLDNNRKLQNKKLNGVPVYSPKKLTREFLEKNRVNTMIFAIRDIVASEKTEILRFGVDMGLEILEVPAVENWLNGTLQLNQLRKIKLKDLLGREPIQLNMKMIENGLRNKTILVTGAAGSIGSEIVRQLTRFSVGQLILIDNAETPMFHLESELKVDFPHAPAKTILGDVTDELKMDQVFRKYQPDIVFHAAAYKHVSLMESNPHEAIRVNVGSTAIMTAYSLKYGVQKFVMVSTDKAVNPTNVMGASKRICEMILQARSVSPGNRTQFVITRFGNVLGSNGSVIPIFRKQIEEGGPVTVTHPDIVRYFMTIPEACQLVLEAGFMGMGGEIFVFDMGEPVKIADLARRMIRLSGFVPDKDIKIEYIGLRPGEKLYEELLDEKERTMPTYNPKVKVAEVVQLDHKEVLTWVLDLLDSCADLAELDLIRKIEKLVPEYKTTNWRFTDTLGEGPFVRFDIYPD